LFITLGKNPCCFVGFMACSRVNFLRQNAKILLQIHLAHPTNAAYGTHEFSKAY
jgi:hypothetical protein